MDKSIEFNNKMLEGIEKHLNDGEIIQETVSARYEIKTEEYAHLGTLILTESRLIFFGATKSYIKTYDLVNILSIESKKSLFGNLRCNIGIKGQPSFVIKAFAGSKNKIPSFMEKLQTIITNNQLR